MASRASCEVQAGNLTLDLLSVRTAEEVRPLFMAFLSWSSIPRHHLALCCVRHLLLSWGCGKPQPVLSSSLPLDPSPGASLFKAKVPARGAWHGLGDVMGQSARRTKGKRARLRALTWTPHTTRGKVMIVSVLLLPYPWNGWKRLPNCKTSTDTKFENAYRVLGLE